MTQFIQQFGNGIMAGSTYGLIALGLTLIYGVLEISQFAIGAQAMIAGYMGYELVDDIGYPAAILVAIVLSAIVGAVIQLAVFDRLRNAPQATIFIAAFGLVLVLEGGALLAFGPDPKIVKSPLTGTLKLFGAFFPTQRVLMVGVLIVAILGLQWMLRSTRTGRRIRATGQNRTGAAVVGISTRSIAVIAMAIGSGLAGLAGIILAPVTQVYPTVGDDYTIKAFVVVILAGMGNTTGVLYAAFAVGLVEALGAGYISLQFSDLYSLALLLIVLVIRPQGILKRSAARI